MAFTPDLRFAQASELTWGQVDANFQGLAAQGNDNELAIAQAVATAGATTIAQTHVAGDKVILVDQDGFPIADSQNGFALREVTWAAIKAGFKAYGDTLYATNAGTVYKQQFSGDGVQTVFTLAVIPVSEATDIYIGGLYQNTSTFTIVGAVITFTEAPPLGVSNIEVNVNLLASVMLGLQSGTVNVTSATYGILENDRDICANFVGTTTYTFPPAANYPGRRINFRTITANTSVSASANIGARATNIAGTAILAAGAGNWAEVKSDGTSWIIVAGS